MLSEKEIEALKNGAYGVTRDGRKVKYLGKVYSNTNGWLTFNKLNEIQDVFLQYSTFASYFNKTEYELDIVGLWVDKPEPFNLDRALAGEPVKWSGKPDVKSWVLPCRSNPNLYIIDTDNQCINSVNVTLYDYDGLKKNCVMWKESELVKPSADDLPKPIREFGDLTEVWFIELDDDADTYIPCDSRKYKGWEKWQHTRLNNGLYYASKEDCKKVCDWLMGR